MAEWFLQQYLYLRKTNRKLQSLYKIADAKRYLAEIAERQSHARTAPIQSEARLARSVLAGSGG